MRNLEEEPTVTKGELETQWGRTTKTEEWTLKLREEKTERWRELRVLGGLWDWVLEVLNVELGAQTADTALHTPRLEAERENVQHLFQSC